MNLIKLSPSLIHILGFFLLLISFSGCNNGLKGTAPSQEEMNNTLAGSPTPVPSVSNPPSSHNWGEVNLQGKVEEGLYKDSLVIYVDQAAQSLIFVLPLPLLFLDLQGEAPIANLPGAKFTFVGNQDGSKSVAVSIPVKYLVKGSSLDPYNSLPNGDPLPFIPAGEKKGFAISLPQKDNMKLHFYFTANAAAIFIETPKWDLPEEFNFLSFQSYVRNHDQQIIGFIKIVPNKDIFSSGVYLAARLPNQIAAIIDDLIRY